MHSLGQFHILRIFLKSTGESNLPSDSNILYSSCSVDLKITWSTHLLPLKRLDLSVVRHESEVTGGISKFVVGELFATLVDFVLNSVFLLELVVLV